MSRPKLAHELRASAVITPDTSFVAIGSQTVLLPFPNAPPELLVSNEVDLYPALHRERADQTDGVIGQLSMFDDTFGCFVDGIGPDTAVMPAYWIDFAWLHCIDEFTAVTLDLRDIAVSRVVAGRDKDANWVRGGLRYKMKDPARLKQRLRALDASKLPVKTYVARANCRAIEATQ